jgi:biopolymer transport protein ExbD
MKIFPSYNHKRRLVLFPLIDIFFILLIFYLFVEQFQPMAAFVDVPKKTGTGQVNAVVQVLDEGRYVWIDSTCFNSFATGERSLSEDRRTEFLNNLSQDMGRFRADLLVLDSTLKEQKLTSYAVLLRCPGNLPYSVVSNMVQAIDEVELGQSQYQLQLAVLGGEASSLSISQGITEGRTYILLDF